MGAGCKKFDFNQNFDRRFISYAPIYMTVDYIRTTLCLPEAIYYESNYNVIKRAYFIDKLSKYSNIFILINTSLFSFFKAFDILQCSDIMNFSINSSFLLSGSVRLLIMGYMKIRYDDIVLLKKDMEKDLYK